MTTPIRTIEEIIEEAKAEFMSEYGKKNPYNLIGILEDSMREASKASREEAMSIKDKCEHNFSCVCQLKVAGSENDWLDKYKLICVNCGKLKIINSLREDNN